MTEEAGSITKMITEIKRKSSEMLMNMTDEEWKEYSRMINEQLPKELNIKVVRSISDPR